MRRPTLSVSGDFSLIEKTRGIGDSAKPSVPSPFDIQKQVTVAIKKGINLKNESGIAY